MCSDNAQLLDPGIYHWESFIDPAAKQYISEIRCLFQWTEEINQPGSNVDQYLNGGGLRVVRIADYNENGEIVRSKSYNYHYSADSNYDSIPEVHSYGRRTAIPVLTRNQIKVASSQWNSTNNRPEPLFVEVLNGIPITLQHLVQSGMIR